MLTALQSPKWLEDSAHLARDSQELVRQALMRFQPAGKPQARLACWQERLGQAGVALHRPLLQLAPAGKAAIREAFERCGLARGEPASP